MNILSLLGGPVEKIIDAVGSLIDKNSTTAEEKLAAKAELEKIAKEARKDLMDAESAIASEQAKVLMAEINAESWLTKNWRPLLMLVFTYIILHNYVLAPIFGLPSTEIPLDMWGLLKLGVGGYILGRSAEKSLPSLLPLFKAGRP